LYLTTSALTSGNPRIMMVLQLGLLVAMVSSCLALLHTPSPPPPISSTPSPSPRLLSSTPYTCDSLLGASLCPLEVDHSTVEVRGEELHYWVYQPTNFTQTSLLPVLLINGGPGYPHNYLLPMKVLACTGRQVVFYDQVGTGQSSICAPPSDPAANPNDCELTGFEYLLELDYYREEVEVLVGHLGLPAYHLLGHSWGSIVATLHAASSPPGLASVVLAGAVANSRVYIDAQWDPVEGNLGTLPTVMQEAIRTLEEQGAYTSEEYLALVADLTSHFTVRTFPAPTCVADCGAVFNQRIYETIQGPSEFSMTEDAVIADMDLSPELRRIALPVLLTNGAFDTMRGPNIRQMAAELADVSTVVFPKSGHMTMVDEPLEMAEVLEYWWQGIEESS